MKFVPVKVSRMAGRAMLAGKVHSPTILFAAGVVGVVGTTVLACRATMKLEEVLSEAEDVAGAADLALDSDAQYSEDDHKHDMRLLTFRTAGKVTVLYAPAALLGIASIACLAGSHNILSKRNAALTAAYAAVDKAFREYRSRVIEELGEDKDREFRHGVTTRTIVEETKNGPVTREIKTFGGASMYAKIFDDTNPNWCIAPEYSLNFLRIAQATLSDKLRADGHLFLNDVYRALGFPDTKAGAIVGWFYDEKRLPGSHGNNFVDFGLFDKGKELELHEFVSGREGTLLVDFNVEGPILDYLRRN